MVSCLGGGTLVGHHGTGEHCKRRVGHRDTYPPFGGGGGGGGEGEALG